MSSSERLKIANIKLPNLLTPEQQTNPIELILILTNGVGNDLTSHIIGYAQLLGQFCYDNDPLIQLLQRLHTFLKALPHNLIGLAILPHRHHRHNDTLHVDVADGVFNRDYLTYFQLVGLEIGVDGLADELAPLGAHCAVYHLEVEGLFWVRGWGTGVED